MLNHTATIAIRRRISLSLFALVSVFTSRISLCKFRFFNAVELMKLPFRITGNAFDLHIMNEVDEGLNEGVSFRKRIWIIQSG